MPQFEEISLLSHGQIDGSASRRRDIFVEGAAQF